VTDSATSVVQPGEIFSQRTAVANTSRWAQKKRKEIILNAIQGPDLA